MKADRKIQKGKLSFITLIKPVGNRKITLCGCGQEATTIVMFEGARVVACNKPRCQAWLKAYTASTSGPSTLSQRFKG